MLENKDAYTALLCFISCELCIFLEKKHENLCDFAMVAAERKSTRRGCAKAKITFFGWFSIEDNLIYNFNEIIR